MIRFALFCVLLAMPARADFVQNNLRITLYHEVGHAVIDLVPVNLFGPEENAADSFALVLADRLHSEEEMAQIVTDMTTLGRVEARREVFDPWAEYMPGAQRLASAICLYYGLNPDTRRTKAVALGMPLQKAANCRDYGRTVRAGWSAVLDSLAPSAPGSATLKAGRTGKAMRLLQPDIDRVNAHIALPKAVPVNAEACDQDNAFYYHYDDHIVICHEMVDALRGYVRARRQ